MLSKPSTSRAKAILGIPIGPHKPINNGFGLCTECGRPIHRIHVEVPGSVTPGVGRSLRPHWRHNPIARLRPIHDNDRTHCSSCGRPFEAYELKPGDGRCKECQP